MGKLFKGCLWVVVAVIVLIILIAVFASGGDDTTENTGTNTTSEQENTGSEEEHQAPEEETYAIGDTVDVGAVQYTVNSKETADAVGPSVLQEEASDKFLVLDVIFKNNGNEAVTVDSSYFKIIRGETTFEADGTASMSANQNEDGTMGDTFFLEEVNPGSERTGRIVFDVAPDIAEANDLQLQVQEGIFGSNTATINLNE